MKQLDIPAIFRREAETLRTAREKSIAIHGTKDIRAAGNEVEESVRAFFRRMLPPRYYVTHGHLIDINGNISSQLDFIISDNFGLPALMKGQDGTEYIPIESTYVFGEIKSTYYRSKKYIEKFSDEIKDIRENLHHTEVPNTFYGVKEDDPIPLSATLQDILLASENKILNYLYTFMLFVDGGDFDFARISRHYTDCNKRHLPNCTVILNSAMIAYGEMEARGNVEGFSYEPYPDQSQSQSADWYFNPLAGMETGSLEGNHLAYLYWAILEHLANSYLDRPSITGHMQKMLIGRKSLLVSAKSTI